MNKFSEISAIIVEDELTSIESLSILLRQYCPEVCLKGVARSLEEAIPLIHQHKPDLVFLDIHLPQQNGFELLEAFSPVPFEVIFTTAYDQHAIRAIKVAALDYLLKPIHFLELRKAVDRFKKRTLTQVGENPSLEAKPLEENLDKQIALPTIDGFQFVPIPKIIRLEAAANYTCFLLQQKVRIVVSKNIKAFEALLVPKGFFRIHRSHLINLRCIKSYKKGKSPQVSLLDGSTLSVSPKKKDTFEKAISHFLAGGI